MSWWAERLPGQEILYVAQTRLDARSHVMKQGDELLRIGFEGLRVYRGVPERLRFGAGSEVNIASPSHSSVHGQSLDLAILDEAWLSLSPDILQGVVPARAARELSMMFAITTMGTESSETWNNLRDRGREGEPGIAYVEYSMDPETQDLFDEDQWPSWMPALGLTVSHEAVRAGMAMLSPAEARRAYGNVTTSTEFDLFDMTQWRDALDALEVPPVGNLILSVDANPFDPGGSVIIAAWRRPDESWQINVVDYMPGASVLWIVERMEDLLRRFKPTAVTMGGGTATRAVKPEVEQMCEDYGIPFRKMAGHEVASAGVLWSDTLRDGKLRHGQSDALDIAMEFAIPKQSDDGWKVDRKLMKVDGSPLAGAVCALFVAQEDWAKRPVVGIF